MTALIVHNNSALLEIKQIITLRSLTAKMFVIHKFSQELVDFNRNEREFIFNFCCTYSSTQLVFNDSGFMCQN